MLLLHLLVTAGAAAATAGTGAAAPVTYDVKIKGSGGNKTAPLAYGLMFEDISHSGDGGIYAELIQNRAFQGSTEYPSVLFPWEGVNKAVLSLHNLSKPLSAALPTSVSVSGAGIIGLSNPGYWGISVKKQTYTGSFWTYGDYKGNFHVLLRDTATVFANVTVPSSSKNEIWTEHTFKLEPEEATSTNNVFVIEFDGDATPKGLTFNLISLFPPTYKDRVNGNRPELMQALKDLNPSFLRMPGGNNIEGDASHYRWQWNKTIGPLKDRPGRPGTWGYQNTDGLGLMEYMNWCDDLEVEPILAIWSGYYLPSGDPAVNPQDVISEKHLGPYVQEALDELEFLTGDTSTEFGALRAKLGREKPWVIKYVEIGNEDMLSGAEPSYIKYRFNAFHDAIHKKYPDIILIASTGDKEVKGTDDKIGTDYHEYARPDRMAGQFDWWDNWNRDYKVLIGEYAVIQPNTEKDVGVNWDDPKQPYPWWLGTVAEAIFLLGAERNTDTMIGASFAPGFGNINQQQWTPNLINFNADPAKTVRSTSWHVQRLFGNYRTTSTVPFKSSEPFGPAFFSIGTEAPGHYIAKFAVYNTTDTSDDTDIKSDKGVTHTESLSTGKAVTTDAPPVKFALHFEGVEKGRVAKLVTLNIRKDEKSQDGWAQNVLNVAGEGAFKDVVQRVEKEVEVGEGGTAEFELAQWDVAVLTV